MKATILLLTALAAAPSLAAENPAPAGETAYVVNDYRFDPAGSGANTEIGHALCATRCNALSVDYRNYVDPGGWRFIKVATGQELVVPLDNPFLKGNCICTVDEYVIRVNEFNRPNNPSGE